MHISLKYFLRVIFLNFIFLVHKTQEIWKIKKTK